MTLREGLFATLLLGIAALLAFAAANALRTGEAQARATRYKKREQPGWYWTIVIGQILFSLYFLAGTAFVSWRALS